MKAFVKAVVLLLFLQSVFFRPPVSAQQPSLKKWTFDVSKKIYTTERGNRTSPIGLEMLRWLHFNVMAFHNLDPLSVDLIPGYGQEPRPLSVDPRNPKGTTIKTEGHVTKFRAKYYVWGTMYKRAKDRLAEAVPLDRRVTIDHEKSTMIVHEVYGTDSQRDFTITRNYRFTSLQSVRVQTRTPAAVLLIHR